MLNLDLNNLAVQSFETSVAGDPTQWDAAKAPACPASGADTCAYDLQAGYIVTCCVVHCDD